MESSCQRGTFIVFVSTVCLFFVTGVVCHDITATCIIEPLGTTGNISGKITLTESGVTNVTTLVGTLSGFSNGTTKRGFHVHQFGNLTDNCDDAGPHYNPFNTTHGAPNDTVTLRHVGDLGNIEVNSTFQAVINITDSVISLHGNYSIVNRSLVVHSMEDDLGRGTDNTSKTTGNSGYRIGCCVIILDTEMTTASPGPTQTHPGGSSATSVGPLTGILLICLAGLHLLMKSIQI